MRFFSLEKRKTCTDCFKEDHLTFSTAQRFWCQAASTRTRTPCRTKHQPTQNINNHGKIITPAYRLDYCHSSGQWCGKMPAKKRRPSQPSKQKGVVKAKKKVNWNKYNKRCSVDGCTKYARNGAGVCVGHGAKVKLCSEEGCKNKARNRGVCKRHGAEKVKQCKEEGCTKQAQNGGVCVAHGAKVKLCSEKGCTNRAQSRGVCITHGAKRKRCNAEGCPNKAVQGGVCVTHGEKVKLCSKEGCKNQVVRRGVCFRHGGKPKLTLCSSEGCNYPARTREDGLCFLHWEKEKYRNAQAAAEQTVAVPALPPPPLEPLPKCAICLDPYDISEMVTCGIESACSYTVCHNCLVRRFSKPWKMVNGQWIYYDPAQCPYCQQEDAFSLNERDQAIVNRETEEMYCYEVASVGASYASTSHEQGDPEWFPI